MCIRDRYWPFDDISLDISGGWDAPTHIPVSYTHLGEVTSTAMSRGMITRKGRQQMVYTSVRPMDA